MLAAKLVAASSLDAVCWSRLVGRRPDRSWSSRDRSAAASALSASPNTIALRYPWESIGRVSRSRWDAICSMPCAHSDGVDARRTLPRSSRHTSPAATKSATSRAIFAARDMRSADFAGLNKRRYPINARPTDGSSSAMTAASRLPSISMSPASIGKSELQHGQTTCISARRQDRCTPAPAHQCQIHPAR